MQKSILYTLYLIRNTPQHGVGLIEVLVAMGILLIIASSASVILIHGFSTNRLADEEAQATLLAQEGIEAVRAIKEQGWTNPFLTTDCSGGCGIDDGSGSWTWNGSTTIHGNFTRTVTVSPVLRDGNGIIVESGGISDSDSRKVTVDVSWSFSPTRQNSVNLVTYLTRFEKLIGGNACENWGSPLVVSDTYNIDPGTQNASKVVTNGDYAYIVRDNNGTTNPDLAIVNISDPNNVSEVFRTDLNGNVFDVFYNNNLLFLATGRGGRQLWIIDVSNPASPNLDYAYAGLPDAARGVHVEGSYIYVVTQNNSGNEFFIFDASSLPALSGPWGVNVGVNTNAVFATGDYALLATSHNNRELMVVDTTNKQAPVLNNDFWVFDTPGCTGDGRGIFAVDNIAFLVTAGCTGGLPELYPLDVSNYQSDITLIGSGLDVTGDANDIFIDSNNQAYLATNVSNGEFMILDVSNPSSGIGEIARANLSDSAFGVHVSSCVGVTATGANTAELQLIIPTP